MDDQERRLSLEDILLEHEMKKKEAKSQPPRASEDIKPYPQPIHTVQETGEDADMKTVPPCAPEVSPIKAAVQRKKEEDTRRLPTPRPVQETETPKTVSVSMRTRLLTVPREEEQGSLYDTHELDTDLDGQLIMDNFMDETMDEEQIEEELLRRRQEKVKGFRIIEGGKAPEPPEKARFKLVGEEEASDPEDDVLPEDDEIPEDLLEDFNEYAEADAIRSELAYRRRTGAFSMMATAIMEIALLILTFGYYAGWTAFLVPSVLATLHTALLMAMLCVNHRMVAGGIKGLFIGRADADTPPAVCGILGLCYSASQFAWLAQMMDGQAYFLSAAAGMAVLAGAIGRQVQIVRIRRNFAFVGNEKQKKYAATMLDDSKIAAGLGYAVGENGIPSVVYYRRVSFLSQFLDTSYASDPADRVMRWFSPLVLGVSLVCAVGYILLFPDEWERAWQLFVSSVLLTMPSWSMYAVQRTIKRACKRTLRKGAMLGGFAAAEQFGNRPKALIMEAAELFSKDQVKLHGIKTFSGTRIDEAITDAAAVMIAAKGPLSPIFYRLIENRMDILREVDSLAYEQDMGLSGWVGGRRVLIGNRRLLENHGVDVPTKEYEARYVRDDRCVVYLSTGGELSAMFVVSYLANPAVKEQLRALEREHVRITVRTCDPNITASLVCNVMELPVRSVDVMSASEGRAYEGLLTREHTERAQAVAASGGHAVSKAFAVIQSCRLRRAAWAALISQLVISVAAMLFCLFISATTGVMLSAPLMIAASVAGGAVGWLFGRLFRS